MRCIVYVRDSNDMTVYQQFNECARYSKHHGYSISGKVLDFDGKNFHDAINKLIADENIPVLLIHNKGVFDSNDDFLFYKIYCDKLGKKIISCT